MRTDIQLRCDQETMPYRQCVGIMLFNRYGLVWVGRRLPKWAGEGHGPFWQMPQGGISKGEKPKAAALRELGEETSVSSVEVLDEIPEWLSYDLPDELLGVALKGRYRGQQQRWYAMRHTGPDSEINIRPRGQKQEFDAWRWARIEEVPELIIPYKREIYQRVVREFAYLAG
jgi:putative (di)nucleoside polyphosphate hydrolase